MATKDTYIVYGIPNCNTVKKSLDWLNANNIPYTFHNYKKEGIEPEKLKEWSQQAGWESLLNKKGTTWRALDKETQDTITTAAKAIALMADKTSSIKRPVIEKDNKIVALGFNEEDYIKAFK